MHDIHKDTPSHHKNVWERLRASSQGEFIQRYGAHGLLVILVIVITMAMRNSSFMSPLQANAREQADIDATSSPEDDDEDMLEIPSLSSKDSESERGIARQALMHTDIPTRARVDVISYEVQAGDSLFGIAEKFNLEPETILWGNYDTLQDNPHVLQPGQILNIMPIDGVYYQWQTGENFDKVAEFFEVAPQSILEWPGNDINIFNFDPANPDIADGTWLIIPGGQRATKDWGPPPISRANPAVAAYYGEGHCGAIFEGATGTGTFVWPTASTWISGYTYDPVVHPAIDIAGSIGNAIFATDSGVIVYAGWSIYGYGNLIVIDHGNGWQSAYAHLSAVHVTCGESVYQGQVIGGLGSTGNSSGAHLHFELRHDQYGKVNPLDYLLR